MFVPWTYFNGLSSHKSPVAQWESIRTSNRKVLGSTPDRNTRIFFQVCLCHFLNNTLFSKINTLFLFELLKIVVWKRTKRPTRTFGKANNNSKRSFTSENFLSASLKFSSLSIWTDQSVLEYTKSLLKGPKTILENRRRLKSISLKYSRWMSMNKVSMCLNIKNVKEIAWFIDVLHILITQSLHHNGLCSPNFSFGNPPHPLTKAL